MIARHFQGTLLVMLVLAFGSAEAASQFEVVIEAVSASTGATPVACPDLIAEAAEAEYLEITCIAVTDGGSLMADVDRSLSGFMDGDWDQFKLWGIPLVFHTPTDSLLAIFVIVADAELPEFTGVIFLPVVPALK